MKNETEVLNEAIISLKEKRAQDLKLLKEQLHTAYENIKPVNLFKNAFKEISSSSDIKSKILSSAIGIGTGILSRKLWIGRSNNPVKRIFGTLIQFAISNVVSKHAGGIKSSGENLLHRYLKKRKESRREFHYNGNDLFI